MKTAAHPYVHAGAGLAGAGALGYYAAKNLYPEQRLERRMKDMGEMNPDVFKKRSRMRAMEMLAATASGGAAGALAPFLVEAGIREGKGLLEKASKDGLRQAQKGLRNAAREAGQGAVEGVAEGVRHHAKDLKTLAEEMGENIGRGATRGAGEEAARAVREAPRRAAKGMGLGSIFKGKKYYEDLAQRL